MVRDRGLEALVADDLAGVSGLHETAMFGGWAWMLHGHLLCCAREEGLLVRLGKGRDGWALAIDGVDPMHAGTRPMHGWVRVAPHLCADATLRRRLLEQAREFVQSLPPR